MSYEVFPPLQIFGTVWEREVLNFSVLNSLVKLSGPGLMFWVTFLITVPISLLVFGLIQIFYFLMIQSWRIVWLSELILFFFSSRFSNLFVYSCSSKPLIILWTSVVSVALFPCFPLNLFIRVFPLFKMNQFINFVYHFKEQFYWYEWHFII